MGRSHALLLLALQFPVPALLMLSASLHSWGVVSSNSSKYSEVSNARLSPDGLCVELQGGETSCLPFIDLILDATAASRYVRRFSRGNAATHEPFDVGATIDAESDTKAHQVDQIASVWCRPTRRAPDEASLLMQGAESAMCLAILETCVFSLGLWLTFASFSLLLAAFGLLSARPSPTCSAFCAYASALLGFVVVILWWSYSSFLVDGETVSSLSLSWRNGSSFNVAVTALVLSSATLWVQVRPSLPNYAQLHALPAGLVLQRGGQQHGTCARPEDPLACPANYVV